MGVDQAAQLPSVSGFGVEVVDGPHAGAELAWHQDEVVLGRKAAGSTLFGGDATVSRRHAVLRHCPDGTCLIDDLGSANGTFVNGVLIDQPTALGPADEFRIGSTRLRLASALADATVVAEPRTSPIDETVRGAAGGKANHGSRRAKEARKARQLSLSILAAIVGTVFTSALNGPPQLRLVAAAVGAAVPAFVTEPGRHQRERVVAATLLMAIALGVTYGGAALFSYATNGPAIFPIPKIVSHHSPAVTPTPRWTPTSTWPTPTPSGTAVWPTPTPSFSVSPTATPSWPAMSTTPTPSPSVSPSPSLPPGWGGP